MTNSELLFYLGVFLFCTGLLIVFTKRNVILVLMGIELMLNAANLNLVVFNQAKPGIDGQMIALFVIVIAVCEAAVGVAIILKMFQHYRTTVPGEIEDLKEKL